MNKKTYKIEVYAVILVSVISVLLIFPLLCVAFYSYPNADDYINATKIYHMFQNGGNIFDAIGIAIQQDIYLYFNWQGAYFSNFWMVLLPGLMGDQYCFIGNFIVLAFFLGGSIYFFKFILKNYCKCNYKEVFLVAMPIILYWIQFMPAMDDGVYGNGGAIYYTLFYGVELIYIVFCIKLFECAENRWAIKYTILCIVMSFILGGVNLVTGLQTCIITVLFTAASFLYNKKKKNFFFAVTLCFLTFFSLSVFAPGNSVRGANTMGEQNPVLAIVYSFQRAFVYLAEWTNSYVILLIIFEIIIFSFIIKKLSFKFPNPLLVLIGSFCIFAANNTPIIYATGSELVAGRILNLIYFDYYLFLLGNIFYFLGWIMKNHDAVFNKIVKLVKNRKLISGVAILILTICMGVRMSDHPTEWHGIRAYKDFCDGVFQQYKIEMDERIQIFSNANVQDAKVKPLTYSPELVNFSNIEKESTAWENQGIARYYGKNSIEIVE